MRSWRGILVFLVAGAALVQTAAAQPEPRLVDVVPGQVGNHLICRLQTQGLPGTKQLQTMRSGLESSVEFQLVLLDEQDRQVANQTLSLRMGFDLWEEVFSVRGAGQDRRFQSLDDLQAYLAELSDIPLAPASRLQGDRLYRVKVGLVVHTLAPDERQKVEDLVAGTQRPRREGQDRQEASVSLGRLIKMFYKGGESSRDGRGMLSAWFTRWDLKTGEEVGP